MVGPGQEGWQAAVEAIDAGEDVNYEGAAGSVDLDENGDVLKGAILIWKVQDEAIETLDSRDVDLSAEKWPRRRFPEAEVLSLNVDHAYAGADPLPQRIGSVVRRVDSSPSHRTC